MVLPRHPPVSFWNICSLSSCVFECHSSLLLRESQDQFGHFGAHRLRFLFDINQPVESSVLRYKEGLETLKDSHPKNWVDIVLPLS